MGISYEKWATCDNCEYQKSYPGEDTDDPPYGFARVPYRQLLFCWDCAERALCGGCGGPLDIGLHGPNQGYGGCV